MKNLALLPFSFSQKFTYCLQTDHKTPLERLSDSAEIFQKIFLCTCLNHFKLEKKKVSKQSPCWSAARFSPYPGTRIKLLVKEI